MKRQYFAGLVVSGVALVGCSSFQASSVVDDGRVDVSTVATASAAAPVLAGGIELGAGDPIGDMLHDYYLVHFQEETQPQEAVVVHDQTDPFDPAP